MNKIEITKEEFIIALKNRGFNEIKARAEAQIAVKMYGSYENALRMKDKKLIKIRNARDKICKILDDLEQDIDSE